ncbi:hypothetical protein XENORESO_021576 [Xenotaenia resolanae]|uniref:Uncharacterized protein n=1 Tax=Xenotaenia resolanae TaxID=208358 RepID=A0ABV0WHK2_9TELE
MSISSGAVSPPVDPALDRERVLLPELSSGLSVLSTCYREPFYNWAQISCFLHRFETLGPMGPPVPLYPDFFCYPVGWFGSCNGKTGLQWLLWIQEGLSAIFRAVGVVRST